MVGLPPWQTQRYLEAAHSQDVKICRFQKGNQRPLGCGDRCQYSNEIHADGQFVVALLVGVRLAEQRQCEGKEQEK